MDEIDEVLLRIPALGHESRRHHLAWEWFAIRVDYINTWAVKCCRQMLPPEQCHYCSTTQPSVASITLQYRHQAASQIILVVKVIIDPAFFDLVPLVLVLLRERLHRLHPEHTSGIFGSFTVLYDKFALEIGAQRGQRSFP